jgi:hypothetical protein
MKYRTIYARNPSLRSKGPFARSAGRGRTEEDPHYHQSGQAIAHIVPDADGRQASIDRVIADIDEFRKTMPRLGLEEILPARHEGHKY